MGVPLAPHEISGPKDAKDVCRRFFEDQNLSYAITIRQSVRFACNALGRVEGWSSMGTTKDAAKI